MEHAESGVVVPYVRSPSTAASFSSEFSDDFQTLTAGRKSRTHSFRIRNSECGNSAADIADILTGAGAGETDFVEFRISDGMWKNQCFQKILSVLSNAERRFAVFWSSENKNGQRRISSSATLTSLVEDEPTAELFSSSLLLNETEVSPSQSATLLLD